ncbi:delta-12 fatty acid desaturase [Mycena capillaripes]|nr:delta-12 fatty acid desaturase [Mycena capillaripes]
MPGDEDIAKELHFRPPKSVLAPFRRVTYALLCFQVSISDIYAAVPKHLFHKSTVAGLYYYGRDISFICVAYKLGTMIEPFSMNLPEVYGFGPTITFIFRWLLWVTYWHWQGVIMAGLWTLAHEAGHGTLSDHNWVNHVIGYTSHTVYNDTETSDQKKTMSLEDDENYVPRTRSDFGLPPAGQAHITDYHDIFEETPIYALLRLVLMQAVGLQAYLMVNALGSPKYPAGTNVSTRTKWNHGFGYWPGSHGLLLVQFGSHFGFEALLKLYFIPYMVSDHGFPFSLQPILFYPGIVALTFLHHSDPTIPHYRRQEWSFFRGAMSTVDRPLLGWAGRFFLKNVSHDHIAHHLFSSIPFYNQPKVTEHIKPVLKNQYNYDSTNTFRALYRSFTQCIFIEDEGDIVFYKNKHGEAARVLHADNDAS